MNQSILRKVLTVGIILLLAAGGARADSHFVTVKVTPNIIHSIFVVGTAGNSPITATPRSAIYPLQWFPPSNGWVKTGYPAFNGTRLKVITFTSPDCTIGATAERLLTVPYNDGLTNFWIDASQPGSQ